jgi:hypothetical protein
MNLSTRPVPFVYWSKTGYDKKGQPQGSLSLRYAAIVNIGLDYANVRRSEFENLVENDKDLSDKKLVHYIIRFNPAFLSLELFTAIPPMLPKEISDFRTNRGQIPSSFELTFIEYLCLVAVTPYEISSHKLARTLKIKSLHDNRRIREQINRCYETGIGLGYLLHVDRDKPGITVESKDVLYLNPEQFYRLRRKALPTSPSPPALPAQPTILSLPE